MSDASGLSEPGLSQPGHTQSVARPLRAALDLLRKERMVLSSLDLLPAFRDRGAQRRTPLADVAAQRGLAAAELDLAGLPATSLRPPGEVRATVLHLHGGGMVAGARDDGVDLAARHAAALGFEVLTLEYPLAPEQDLPTMTDAVVAAVRAAHDRAASAGAAVPLVLQGHSGGGGLALAVGLACRDAGVPLAGLLLVCPMLGNEGNASRAQFAAAGSWDAVSDAVAWQAIEGDAPAVRPGLRDDLAGLPPTFLDAGTAELFRDEVLFVAGRLLAAGVQAELHLWSGAFHASDCLVEDAVVSVEAHRTRGEWLRRLLDDAL